MEKNNFQTLNVNGYLFYKCCAIIRNGCSDFCITSLLVLYLTSLHTLNGLYDYTNIIINVFVLTISNCPTLKCILFD